VIGSFRDLDLFPEKLPEKAYEQRSDRECSWYTNSRKSIYKKYLGTMAIQLLDNWDNWDNWDNMSRRDCDTCLMTAGQPALYAATIT
jgi:hypothetical protein